MYTELAFYHKQIMQAYEQIALCESQGTRFLGSYYRVAFFGKRLLPSYMHGRQYIYKMPKITSLGESIQKLKADLQLTIAPDAIRVIMDSRSVDIEALDESAVHIQVTSVHPFFSDQDIDGTNTA